MVLSSIIVVNFLGAINYSLKWNMNFSTKTPRELCLIKVNRMKDDLRLYNVNTCVSNMLRHFNLGLKYPLLIAN